MVNRYLRWRAKQGDLPLEPLDDIQTNGGDIRFAIEQERLRLRRLILTDPKRAAVEFEIPHLAFHPASPDKPQFTLTELGEFWKENARNNHGQKLSPKHLANSLTFWTEFVDCVAVTYVRDISGEHVQTYLDKIMAEFDDGKSAAYVRSRFVAVKSIIGYPLKRTETSDAERQEHRRVLDICKALSAPSQRTDPNPISPDEFQVLLKHADKRLTAALLLGLNCAMHLGEVTATKVAEIDLDAGTFVARRNKNAQPRVATLWQRTIDAIREYQSTLKGKSPYLFRSQRGSHPGGEAFRQKIVAIRKSAKLPETVTFEGLRDAAYTVAQQSDVHHAKFIVGHKTGMADKYVLRQATNPKVVACCEAIEQHFFPSKTKILRGKKSSRE